MSNLVLQQINRNFVPLKAKPYWQTTELAYADSLSALTVLQLTRGQQ